MTLRCVAKGSMTPRVARMRRKGSMTPRVVRLRRRSLSARPSISTERAELVTESYAKERGVPSEPLRRARAFAHLMENKKVFIDRGELIVGERGPSPKATPTFPELCCHSLEDLDILDRREKTSFSVSKRARRVYEKKIIPFWKERSMRDLIFDEMRPEWKEAYNAGIFTEFMEKRAPGHTVCDGKIYEKGMLDFVAGIEESLARLDWLKDPAALAKKEELEAMAV